MTWICEGSSINNEGRKLPHTPSRYSQSGADTWTYANEVFAYSSPKKESGYGYISFELAGILYIFSTDEALLDYKIKVSAIAPQLKSPNSQYLLNLPGNASPPL